ncbi:MAG: SulP family inorganic anion transporter [Chloroflexota bacterium]|nr:SulP family inorganic anion transporter [Chloroflexota bacterium]
MKFSTKNIKRYFRGKFRSDLSAGLTVAMIVIPQSMAYAAIVGINPIYGLFTAIIPTIIAAIFGSFPYLITGPTNPTALVTASLLMNYANRSDYFEFVFALAIIAGLIYLLFGLLKLGAIIRYISNSVLVGFLTAVGVLIISFQFGNLLGVELVGEKSVWGVITSLGGAFSNINLYTLLISGLSFSLLLILRRINRKFPAALITVILATLLVYLTGWGGAQNVRLVSDFQLPENIQLGFHIPKISFKEFTSLGSSGVVLAVFGLMETLSIAKAMSQMTGEHFDPSQQMIGQGLALFVGGFFQCMPASGSPSRTVINVVNGARTRFSAIISGLGVLIFLLLFSRMIVYIPVSALAAVVIVSAAGLVNISLIKLTWQSHAQSRAVMLITFISTLVLPLEYAIYLGILTTIVIYLGVSSRMNLSYIIENEQGQFIEYPLQGIEKRTPHIAIINIEGDLFFAAVQDLQDQVERILETEIKVLILRFRRSHLLASTGVMALDRIVRSAHDKNVHILFCGLQNEVLVPLEAAGVTDLIGESRIFLANNQLFNSTQNALEAAKEILKQQAGAENGVTRQS